MDIKFLSALLGHAQASTTLNLYGHVLPDHKKISMEKMRGNYMNCSSISGGPDDTVTDASQVQEPAISTTAENLQEQEVIGDTNTAMPQIHDSTADTNANEEQAQAS